ncbi:MAG: hypothetical protein ACR2N5_03210 [Solirubrobacterales bacterium]
MAVRFGQQDHRFLSRRARAEMPGESSDVQAQTQIAVYGSED